MFWKLDGKGWKFRLGPCRSIDERIAKCARKLEIMFDEGEYAASPFTVTFERDNIASGYMLVWQHVDPMEMYNYFENLFERTSIKQR